MNCVCVLLFPRGASQDKRQKNSSKDTLPAVGKTIRVLPAGGTSRPAGKKARELSTLAGSRRRRLMPTRVASQSTSSPL
eukprot:4219205-Pyramimonas_sp.AAC.1